MDDEIRIFAEGRPDVPPYPREAREAARRRLLEETRARRGFRLPRLGWQAAGAFGLTVALVGGVAFTLSSTQRDGTAARPAGAVTVAPPTEAVTVEAGGELDPKPGQFVLVESETMYPSYSFGEQESRHLYRTKRQLWRSVDASADGLMSIEGMEPRQFPGWPLPEHARKWQGTDWHRLASCPDTLGAFRNDYAFLSTLPDDPERMKDFLAQRAKNTNDDAFRAAADLIRETYVPKAQRAALFAAMKELPGVEVAEGVEDGAGRKGTALGRAAPEQGTVEQLIFDPETFAFMGERGTVVDEKAAKAPVGTLLSLTAQTAVSVVDTLPDAPTAGHDSACDPQPTPSQEPVKPTPTGTAPDVEPTPIPSPPAKPRRSADPSAPESIEPTPVPTETPSDPATATVVPTRTG
ncbi:CU044_5270 family protein [Nonomuraea recticatena]|uniref:CU044_5270 family protein n=1 Tax=Nonomuraea recticatena TaxID=46178 RepID=A0ABN3RDE2_9ACTN